MNMEVQFYEEDTFVVESDSELTIKSLINHIYPSDSYSISFSDLSSGRKVSLVVHGDASPDTGFTLKFTNNISANGDIIFTGEDMNKVVIIEFMNIGFSTWVECYRSTVTI